MLVGVRMGQPIQKTRAVAFGLACATCTKHWLHLQTKIQGSKISCCSMRPACQNKSPRKGQDFLAPTFSLGSNRLKPQLCVRRRSAGVLVCLRGMIFALPGQKLGPHSKQHVSQVGQTLSSYTGSAPQFFIYENFDNFD